MGTDLFRVCAKIRLLFDGAYDFSYVCNSSVSGFAEALRASPWREIVDRLIRHRRLLDDTTQYVALHTQPLSSWLSTVGQSAVARRLLVRAACSNHAASLRMVDRLSATLTGDDLNHHRFARRFSLLRLLCLLMAAFWPRDTLRSLASRSHYSIGDDLIASSLLRRLDVRDDILMLVADLPLLEGFSGLVARHVPALSVTNSNAHSYAQALRGAHYGWRRAKQYLIAHHAAAIGAEALADLVAGLDTIPYGIDSVGEHTIAAVLEQADIKLRFDLVRGIDWTILEDA